MKLDTCISQIDVFSLKIITCFTHFVMKLYILTDTDQINVITKGTGSSHKF